MHRRSRSGRHHRPVSRFEPFIDALVLAAGLFTFRWALGA